MASKREVNLENQVIFRNELCDERTERMEQAGKILTDIHQNHDCGRYVDRKLAEAINILAGITAI
jgi:hypothetical protein